MKKKTDKQRLFEVMGRLDKTFKPQLNEKLNEEKPFIIEKLPNEVVEEMDKWFHNYIIAGSQTPYTGDLIFQLNMNIDESSDELTRLFLRDYPDYEDFNLKDDIKEYFKFLIKISKYNAKYKNFK